MNLINTNLKEEVNVTELFRCEVGSTLHGISNDQTDLDFMSVAMEPRDSIFGINNSWEHQVLRTAEKDQRSQPGDVDWTIYGLRKFLRLATKGNPTMILPFYAPSTHLEVYNPAGDQLLGLYHAVMSLNVYRQTRGYINGQRQRALNEQSIGHGRQDDGRIWKWSAHMVRLSIQLCELLEDEMITLPMHDDDAHFIQSVRMGEVGFSEVLGHVSMLENKAETLMKKTDLPDKPDYEMINEWLYTATSQWYASLQESRSGNHV